MTIREENEILKKALLNMGKYCRQNLPVTLDSYVEDPDFLKILVGGMARDPEGKEYAYYFLGKAIQELNLNKEE